MAGLDAVIVNLQGMRDRAPLAAAAAATAMGALMVAETMKTLGTSSHTQATRLHLRLVILHRLSPGSCGGVCAWTRRWRNLPRWRR